MATDYNEISDEYKRSKLQPWRRYVETYTLFELVGDVSGKAVLDLACGEGFHTRFLKQRGAARVVGVDLSSGMIDLARDQEQREPLGIEFRCDDVLGLDLDERFDLVFAAYLLNYAETPDVLFQMCESIARHLEPGGRFVTINNNPEYRGGDESMRPYGFTRAAAQPEEGMAVDWTFYLDDGPFTITNYQLSVETHERAFARAGFVDLRWVHGTVSPNGNDEHGSDYWTAFVEAEPAIFLEATAPPA